MKIAPAILLFMICFNLAAYALAQSGVEVVSGLLPGLNYTNLLGAMNGTQIGYSAPWGPLDWVLNIAASLQYILNTLMILVAGMPYMLASLGMPAPMVYMITGVYAFVWFMWIAEFISGRQTD